MCRLPAYSIARVSHTIRDIVSYEEFLLDHENDNSTGAVCHRYRQDTQPFEAEP